MHWRCSGHDNAFWHSELRFCVFFTVFVLIATEERIERLRYKNEGLNEAIKAQIINKSEK